MSGGSREGEVVGESPKSQEKNLSTLDIGRRVGKREIKVDKLRNKLIN